MSNPRSLGGAHRDLTRLFSLGTLNGLTEPQLLDRFLETRDERAFEALIERHGPMVLSTCRALLRDSHEAEDAFQATFLVLARRADSIRNPALLGPWLHRVARRVALRAGRRNARRQAREQPAQERIETAVAPEGRPFADRAAVLEEVDRLPERYRRVVVLCDLQSLSHAEAALRLGWPIGTVKGRQSRARDLLRRRLTRRGLAEAAVGSLLAGLASASTARAAGIPPALVVQTARAAAGFAAGGAVAAGSVPVGSAALARGVLTTMIVQKLRFAAFAAVVPLGLVAGGLGGFGASGANRPPEPSEAPPKPASLNTAEPENTELDELFNTWRRVSTTGGVVSESSSLTIVRDEANRPADQDALLGVELRWLHMQAEGRTLSLRYGAVLDPTTAPIQFDTISVKVKDRGVASERLATPPRLGILRIEGDVLTLCWRAKPGPPRPDTFRADPEKGWILEVYVRAPDSEPPPAEPRTFEEFDASVQIDEGAEPVIFEETSNDDGPKTAEENVEQEPKGRDPEFLETLVRHLEVDRNLLRMQAEVIENEMRELYEQVVEEAGTFEKVDRGDLLAVEERLDTLRDRYLSAIESFQREDKRYRDARRELLEARSSRGAFEPRVIGPGDVLRIEVLEALPGRPITGERIVRSDGTISLDYYGDLPVVGLTRDEIKIKVIEHLSQYLSEGLLGLQEVDPTNVTGLREVPPAQSTRVFVDDTQPEERPDPPLREEPGLERRLEAIETKLDRLPRRDASGR